MRKRIVSIFLLNEHGLFHDHVLVFKNLKVNMVSGHLKLVIIPYLVGPILNNVAPCTLDRHLLYVRKFAVVLFSGSLNF